MIEQSSTGLVWPIQGSRRRFVPISDAPVEALESFCQGRKNLRTVVATLEAIANMEQPTHPKLGLMKGHSNLYEYGPFGPNRQGRLYFYRARVDGVDTFLFCEFLQKKKDKVPAGLEDRITKAAQQYISRTTRP